MDARLVVREPHLFYTPIELHSRRFNPPQRIDWLVFIIDMQLSQFFPCISKSPEVRREGEVRQIALEVDTIPFAIIGTMQQPIRIVENVPLLNRRVAVMRAELGQCPIGDVLAPISAILIVDVKRKALSCA